MVGENVRRSGKVALFVGLLVMAVNTRGMVHGAEPISIIKIPADTVSLASSPDGKLIVAAGGHMNRPPLTVWNVTTGEQVANLKDAKIPFGSCRTAAFSPDGKFLAAVCDYNRVEGGLGVATRVWDTTTWRMVRRHRAKNVDRGDGLAFSPDSQLLATSHMRLDIKSFKSDNVVCLWDVKTGQLKTTFDTGREMGGHIAFSHDGKYLACVFSEHVYVWETNTFRRHTILGRKGKFMGRLRFSPDGKSLLVIEGGNLFFFDTSRWRKKKHLHLTNHSVNRTAFLPNSQRIIIVKTKYMVGQPTEQSVVIYDYKIGREVMTVVSYPPRGPRWKDFHYGVRTIGASSRGDFIYVALLTKGLTVWDLKKVAKNEDK